MLRNIIGPLFNFNLDHILTLEICFVVFFLGGGCFLLKPLIFTVFSAKMQKLKKHKKRQTDTICEHNCANNSCQKVRF